MQLRPLMLFSAMLIMLAALGWGPAFGAADGQSTLRRVVLSVPDQLDPQRQSYVVQRVILNDIFMGLTEIDQEGRVVPGVADRWTLSADGLTYTFHLRPDAKWHDGAPVQARDFALAFARLFSLGGEARLANLFSMIEGHESLAGHALPLRVDRLATLLPSVKATDARTLRIHLSRPFPEFLFLLSKPPAFPVPSHLYGQVGEAWTAPQHLIGNGAYRFAGIDFGSAVYLEKSAHFYAAATTLYDKVQHLSPGQGMTIGRMMSAGQADLSSEIPGYQMQAAQTLPGYGLVSQQSTSLMTLLLNIHHEALSVPAVRRALYLAIDRDLMVRTLSSDFMPVRGLVPPLGQYDSPVPAAPERADMLEEAATLMQAAGYTEARPLQLTLTVPEGIGEQALAAQVKRDWARIHVRLDIRHMAFQDLLANMARGKFDVVRREWNADYPDPYNFLQIYTHAFNAALFDPDPKLEALLARANAATDERAELLRQAELHLMGRYVAVPLFMRTSHFLISDQVGGWSGAAWAKNASRSLWPRQASMAPAGTEKGEP